MGANLNNTIFLEFYGLPGCGKSTISHKIAKLLRIQGYRIFEPTYILDHNYSSSKRKLLKTLFTLEYFIYNPISFLRLLFLVISNGYKRKDILSQVVNIAYKLAFYRNTNSDYIIMDEGLTQSAISLSQSKKKSSVNNEKILYDFSKNRKVIKIYINVSTEEALNRLSKRNKHDSRIEKINDYSERKLEMTSIYNQCKLIKFDCSIENRPLEESIECIIIQLNRKKV